MLTLLSLLFSTQLWAVLSPVASIPVTDSNLSFEYTSSDGEISMSCKHSQVRYDLPDWQVVCGKGTKLEKKFGVHFVIYRGSRSVEPKTWYEVLYWVTDRQNSIPLFSSTSMTVNLSGNTSTHSIRLYQSVENDYASLIINYF